MGGERAKWRVFARKSEREFLRECEGLCLICKEMKEEASEREGKRRGKRDGERERE